MINSIRLFADTPLRVASDGSAKDTPLPTHRKMHPVAFVHTCTPARVHTCTQLRRRWLPGGDMCIVRYFFIPFTSSQAGYRTRYLRFLLRSIIIQTNIKQDKNLWCRVVELDIFQKKSGSFRCACRGIRKMNFFASYVCWKYLLR